MLTTLSGRQTPPRTCAPLCPPDRTKLLDAIRAAFLTHHIIFFNGHRYTYLKPNARLPHYRIVSKQSPDGVYVELTTLSRWQWLSSLEDFFTFIAPQVDALSDFDKICLWFTVRQAQETTLKRPLLHAINTHLDSRATPTLPRDSRLKTNLDSLTCTPIR